MSRVDLAELDFFSPEVQECPFSVYQQLQDEDAKSSKSSKL